MRHHVAATILGSALLAALAGALSACADDGAVTGAFPKAAAGRTEVGATYVLRRVDGRPLPARAHVTDEGFTEFLADTLRFAAGGEVRQRRVTRTVIAQPAYARDTVFDESIVRRYTRDGAGVRVTPGGICDEGDALALCVPPDTGAFRGDSLILALQMPGAPRRAYVRVE